MTTSGRYVAAGGWLLAAGLLVSVGGATAFADAGSHPTKNGDSSSAAKSHAAGGRSGTRHRGRTATDGEGPHAAADDAATKFALSAPRPSRSGTDRTDPVTKPTTQITRPVTVAAGVREMSDAASTSDASLTDSAAGGEVASAPINEVQPPPTDTAPTDDPPPPADVPAGTTIDTAVPELPANDATAPVSDQVPSTSSEPTPAPTQVDPVPQDASEADSNSGDTASIPDPAVPISDVTSVTQDEPTSTTDTVAPLPELPAESEPLPGATVAEVHPEADDVNTRGRSAAPDGRALSPLQILRLLTQASGSSFVGKPTGIPMRWDGANQTRSGGAASVSGTTAALAGTSSRSMAARAEPDMALPEGLQTVLHVCGQVIVAVSLSAMIVAALPGLAGIVIPSLAGTCIGYRQAKARSALRMSGIAHLAASGPIGVVRSGSLVAMRPRRSPLPPPITRDLSQDVA